MERSFIARLSGVDVSGRKTYDLVDEPTGDDYRALLLCARSQCDTAVLTVDTTRDLDPSGRAVVERLAPELRSESRSGDLRLLRYELSQACVDVLGEAPGLFAWRQPGLPENLCLLRQDGSPWIVSIAAERIGYVEFTPFEKLLLGRAAPGLAAVLAHQGARDAILAAFERRLEDAAEAMEADLLVYARSVAEDGRDGVVAAVRDWLGSGELVRLGAAVHLVARLGLTELGPELGRLAEAARRDQLPGPTVYRSSPVLRERWRIRFERRLGEATTVLETIRSG
ncbi:MAG: hypothetical protein ABSC16_06610 [Candidatus Dormibacteria bacterium]|jgi:hypothetical protein|nr:hypothetical protein [Chloroflexota bacterium]HBV93506.1 hypothetical protein [Chloroflexota bacterium]